MLMAMCKNRGFRPFNNGGVIYVKNVYAFDIYDRRTGDQIDERTLDEAIKNHLSGVFDETMSEDDKLDLLADAGYSIRPLEFIETCRHSGPMQVGEELKSLEEHIQVDFNYPDKTISFDLHMEEEPDGEEGNAEDQ